ncbi:MAG TPA: NADH-dependent [FeFe] hydrogenase, group A6 [Bacteroidales bacterium]|nr:NADH-dependent [FeFe] hydrogenase, group A6 [Bacteroidales bacterium]
MDCTIEVNNKKIAAEKGELLIDALSRNGIRVPTLCHMKNFMPSGSCRMCVVENQSNGRLITSCSYPVEEGMKIQTNSPRVVESRKVIVELLLSNHPDDCLYCVRNGKCTLQDLAGEHNVVERRISGKKNDHHKDLSSLSIVRDPDKCILCGRCVRVCEEVMDVSAIDYINRGSRSVIGTAFNKGLNVSSCVNCGQCILVCPTGALSEKPHINEVQMALNDKDKMVIVQYAPAVTVSIAEEFGLEPGADLNGMLNAALRKMGFDRVYDTSFSADLTIMEESAELIHRIQNNGVLPMITSCCPAWIKYAEEFAHDMLPNLSTCKSPQQMLGAVVKSHISEKEQKDPHQIYSVSIMPCVAKKFEAQRENMTHRGITDVDAVLSTRELIRLIRLYGIEIEKLEPETADSPLGVRSSAGKLFGNTGGVMEAAIRTAYYALTGKDLVSFRIPEIRGFRGRKETRIRIGDLELGVAVVSGLKNAHLLLEEIRNGRNDIHFIEVMACPGGCVAGGGQRIGCGESDILARMRTLYAIDDQETIKMSHKNPEVAELYREFLGEPLGHKSHELLHTSYMKRDVML